MNEQHFIAIEVSQSGATEIVGEFYKSTSDSGVSTWHGYYYDFNRYDAENVVYHRSTSTLTEMVKNYPGCWFLPYQVADLHTPLYIVATEQGQQTVI